MTSESTKNKFVQQRSQVHKSNIKCVLKTSLPPKVYFKVGKVRPINVKKENMHKNIWVGSTMVSWNLSYTIFSTLSLFICVKGLLRHPFGEGGCIHYNYFSDKFYYQPKNDIISSICK